MHAYISPIPHSPVWFFVVPWCVLTRLLVVVISLVVNDVEELELVHSLGGRDDTQPVTELHLLQELLSAIG